MPNGSCYYLNTFSIWKGSIKCIYQCFSTPLKTWSLDAGSCWHIICLTQDKAEKNVMHSQPKAQRERGKQLGNHAPWWNPGFCEFVRIFILLTNIWVTVWLFRNLQETRHMYLLVNWMSSGSFAWAVGRKCWPSSEVPSSLISMIHRTTDFLSTVSCPSGTREWVLV